MITTLQTIVAGLKANPAIFALLGARIYIGQPMQVPSDTYLTINIISQVQNIEVNNRTRVEFRIIGKDGSNYQDLDNIQVLITNYLKDNHSNLGLFKMEIANYYNGVDELKRFIIVRDFILYQII